MKYTYAVQYGSNNSLSSFNTKAEAIAFMTACWELYPECAVRMTRFSVSFK